MRTLRPSEVESIRVSIPTESVKDPSLGSHCLKKLAERLRASYDVVVSNYNGAASRATDGAFGPAGATRAETSIGLKPPGRGTRNVAPNR